MESVPVDNRDLRDMDQQAQAQSSATEPETQKKIFFETKSLAEVYAQQGHVFMSLEIYRRMQKRNPSDPHIQNRISELEARLSARRGMRPKEQNE